MSSAPAVTGLVIAVMWLCASDVRAEARTAFAGIPAIKISEGGTERVPERLDRSRAASSACVISEIAGKYYWATRENKSLIRHEGTVFITFSAADGSGYVRVIAPGMKPAAALLGDAEAKFDYVEHLLVSLRSVTYYGKAR